MKAETIHEYTTLYQYLLLLKEPTYRFLIQVFHHLSPLKWWEDYIEPVLKHEKKDNFKYLDVSDLLNVFKMNWDVIFKYLDKKFYKFKYDKEYKLVNKIHKLRTVVAHANDVDMSPYTFVDGLNNLWKFSKLIQADPELTEEIEGDLNNYKTDLPARRKKPKEETVKLKILGIIEDRVMLKAKSCETLPADVKLSIDRTMLRLHSMRTLDEVHGILNNSLTSERGLEILAALRKEGLLAFEDVIDEINAIYTMTT